MQAHRPVGVIEKVNRLNVLVLGQMPCLDACNYIVLVSAFSDLHV